MHVSNESKNHLQRRLVFIGTTRLHFGTDGKIRSLTPVMSAEEWGPFLQVFKEIEIIARIDESFTSDKGYVLDDPRIKFKALPFYDGPLDFYSKRREIIRFALANVTDPHTVFLTWVPNVLALPVARKAKQIGAPLVVRVVGDAAGVSQAIAPRPLNLPMALKSRKTAQQVVKLADAVIYVTIRALQRSYPASNEAITLARTNMKFPPELLSLNKSSENGHHPPPHRLIAVGSQEQNYKGHDLLIRAVAGLQRDGHDISLTLVGSGRLHNQLVELAEKVDAQNIEFIKHLGTSLDVARYITKFDMFVMPSRTEGMPKALMEAMAVGVLAIGSSVGGIPELLEKACTFEPNSVSSLQERIRTLTSDPSLAEDQRRNQMETIRWIKTEHAGSSILTQFLEDFITRINESRRV